MWNFLILATPDLEAHPQGPQPFVHHPNVQLIHFGESRNLRKLLNVPIRLNLWTPPNNEENLDQPLQ